MAADEILRHSSAGAGILHRRPHTIPANETTVFLLVETLAHSTLWINLDDPARFLYVLFVLSTPKPKHPSPIVALDIIPHDLRPTFITIVALGLGVSFTEWAR
ncbi:hypothetical protein PENSUB_10627 [Penicillium subrubescens]|uniref:Uncharacterized protein n=1 Tax=Penicillium subrubescens TaxID=1316194 RepID=A0A1Q5T895_9EURO|nr:hypothetical protein PENSUB_10627 [Penicillium subrubescens]